MEQILNLLIDADKSMESISVRGRDVYEMVHARNLLRAAFDAVKKEVDKNNVPKSEPAVQLDCP